MSPKVSTKQDVKVEPPFPITIEDYAIAKFAEHGRTVMVTRWEDAPIEPFREYDSLRDIDLIIKVATPEDIEELKKIKQMRQIFQILESVPYTDIIIGDEVPTEAQIATREKQRDNFNEGLVIFGNVLKYSATAAMAIVFFTITIVSELLCGKDPIVWARTPNGAWIELARFYS